MGFLIGMDEAGYGPNYGPLVVAATVWQVAEEEVGGQRSDIGDDSGFGVQGSGQGGVATKSAIPGTLRVPKSEIDVPDLYRLLRGIIAKSSSERRIAIADSKTLYKPGLGLRQLERGVHSVLAAIENAPTCWSVLSQLCDADPYGHGVRERWHAGYDCNLPLDAASDEISRLSARLSRACESAGAMPLAMKARYVFPAEFNDLVEHYGSKGAALSHVTVGLLREIVDALQPGPVFALCDKHGGRNFYGALLQHHFSEHCVRPTRETHAESYYEWGPSDSRVEVVFRMQGEKFMPTALASMTAKYLRELAMRPFNEYWCARVPGLRPTAGYPTDAHRFRKGIAAMQTELGIDDRIIWRNR